MRTASLAAMAALSLIATTAHAQSVEVEIDRFELQEGEGDDPFLFDSTASVGGEAVALVLKAEGVNEAAHLDVNEVESKAMLAFSPVDGMTLMAGVRHDSVPAATSPTRPSPSNRRWAPSLRRSTISSSRNTATSPARVRSWPDCRWAPR